MGYLDNSSITVDAVLTKKGREILKNGGTDVNGGLNITSFTCSDTAVDYTLWNPTHPSGSSHYGSAIENLPMLEASVHAEYNLRNRLITLNQNTVAIPVLIISGLDSAGATTLTFNEGDQKTAKGKITVELLGFGAASGKKYVVIQDPSLVTVSNATYDDNISGTTRSFLPEQDISHAEQYSFSTNMFTLKPTQQDVIGRQTNVYVVDERTGAYVSFVVTNNILLNETDMLSQQIQN